MNKTHETNDIQVIKQILISNIDSFCPLQGSFKDGRPAYDDPNTHERWTLNPIRSDNYCDSFSVNLETGLFNDFATGQEGDIIYLYECITGKSFHQILEEFSPAVPLSETPKNIRAPKSKAAWKAPPAGYKPSLESREEPSAIYPYTDAEGVIQFWVLRWNHTDGKVIRPAYYGTDNRLHLGIPEHRSLNRPLYKLYELKKNHTAPVMVVEGEKAADAAAQLYPDYQVVSWIGGAHAVGKTDWTPLRSRSVLLWPDADEPGLKAMKTIEKLLSGTADISWVDVSKRPSGWDAADLAEEIRGTSVDPMEELKKMILPTAQFPSSSNSDQEDTDEDQKPKRPQSQADILQDLIIETSTIELWHDQDHEPYITSSGEAARGTFRLGSGEAKRLIRRLWHQHFPKKALNGEALNTTFEWLDAQAQFSGKKYTTAIRLAGDRERVYVDLGDESWKVVEITASGWSLKSAFEIPFRFYRSGGMLALPVPQSGGGLTDLQQFLNIHDESTWALAAGWLLGCYLPSGPFPGLIVRGPQGSAKSTMCRFLRALVDPNKAPLRSPPSSEQDLAIAANSSWLLGYDNLSSMKHSLADCLCTLSTGGGFATRKLYTNLEETIVSFCRPWMVNGIDNLSNRMDLLDRSIIIDLKPINENSRMTAAVMEELFEQQSPRILGAIYTALASVLKNLPQTELPQHPRMADFCQWVTAGEDHLKLKEDTFFNYYVGNRYEVIDDESENDSVVQFILIQLEQRNPWEGSASELLNSMTDYREKNGSLRKDWPRNVQGLTGRLRRIQPMLDRLHISIEHSRTKSQRTLTIIKTETPRQRKGAQEAELQNVSMLEDDMSWLERVGNE